MDADDYYCGTCRHGILLVSCPMCEDEYEEKLKEIEKEDKAREKKRIMDNAYKNKSRI